MTQEKVHTIQGKPATERSLCTPDGNITIIRGLLRRVRPMLSQAMATEIDVGLECLEDLRKGLGERS